jgi:hypothetical protein
VLYDRLIEVQHGSSSGRDYRVAWVRCEPASAHLANPWRTRLMSVKVSETLGKLGFYEDTDTCIGVPHFLRDAISPHERY